MNQKKFNYFIGKRYNKMPALLLFIHAMGKSGTVVDQLILFLKPQKQTFPYCTYSCI